MKLKVDKQTRTMALFFQKKKRIRMYNNENYGGQSTR